MISLFPREQTCAWCGRHHEREGLCSRGMTRRSFLFLSGGAAVGLMLPSPAPEFFRPITYKGIPFTYDLDLMLKEIYLPAIREQLNTSTVLLQFLEPKVATPCLTSPCVPITIAPRPPIAGAAFRVGLRREKDRAGS